MKRAFFIGSGLLIILLLSGCFHSEEKGAELTRYYNGWLEIRNEEPSYSSFFSLAMEEDTEEAKQLINEALLPVFNESVDYLANIELEFKEMKELHELHLKVEKYSLDFYMKSLCNASDI